jgi:hypothetical protein
MFLALATDHFADRTGEEKPNPRSVAILSESAKEKGRVPND